MGDFDGDGIDEIAMLLSDGATIQLYKVNSQTLAIVLYKTLTLPNSITPGTLAAGRFGTSGKVMLAAAGQLQNDTNVTVYYIDPAQTSQQIVKTASIQPTDGYYNGTPINGVIAQSAPIIASSSASALPGQSTPDQLVLGIQYVPPHKWSGGFVWIGTFNSAGSFTLQESTEAPHQNGCLIDMKVGNYNNTVNGQPQRSLQVALLENLGSGGANCTPNFDGGYLNVEIFNIGVPGDVQANPQGTPKGGITDWSTQASIMVPNIGSYDNLQGVSLVAGDFQGRSLQLGAPTKITLQGQIQPTLVLGMPPMHIDYINPTSVQPLLSRCSTTAPKDPTGACELNLTYRPTAPSARRPFNSTYQFTGQQEIDSSRKATTSWGVYVQDTTSNKLKVAIPGEGAFTLDTKISAKYKHDETVTKQYNSYQGISETLAQTTGQSDFIFFTEANQNIYQYPVLGRADNAGSPLYAAFSVPSHVQYSSVDGATQDWYQPIQEPGNILSYPWSRTALANEYPNGTAQISESSCQYTDTSTGTYTNFWKSGSTSNVSSATSNSIEGSINISGSYEAGFKLFGYGASDTITGSVESGANGVWNSLNVSGQTLSQSQGIQVSRGSFNNLGPARYAFKSYIYGSTNVGTGNQLLTPQGTFDNLTFNSNPDVQTTGPLFLGFAANPLIGGGSDLSCASNQAWWQQVYTMPDIALNHPLRVNWSKTSSTASLLTVPTAGGSVIDEPFYQMKGVWITQQTDQINTAGIGMNLQSAKAGDQLTVTARVYNYSLVSTQQLNPGAQVHVRIYGQQVCSNTGQLCNSAFQIPGTGNADGDIIINAIPGFNQTDAPNWALASANFDTTPYGGMELAFWVVAWLADGNGTILSEMPSHGIASAKSFNGEKFSQLTDVPLEKYSNNVGLYRGNSPFYVRPANSAIQNATLNANLLSASSDVSSTPESGSNSTPGALQTVSLSAPSYRLPLDERARIAVTFQAGSAPTQDAAVAYYDGDPQAGGQLFDLQHVRELDANATTARRIFYRPQSCGLHDLYAVPRIEGLAPTVGRTKVIVEVDPLERLANLQGYVQGLQTESALKRSLLLVLRYAQDRFREGQFARGKATLRVFHEVVQFLSDLNENIFSDQADVLLAQSEAIFDCNTLRVGYQASNQ